MKLSETFKEILCYAFLLLVLCFMLLSCNLPKHKTEDTKVKEWQKKQLEILKSNNNLNK